MTNEIKISVRAYAKQLHVDEKAVRNAIRDGKIKKGYNKKTQKITASLANKEWGFVHENPKAQRGVSKAKVADKLNKKESIKKGEISEEKNDFEEKDYSYSELIKETIITPQLTYQEAIRRKEILSIAKEKMELEEKQGILVRKVDVDRALFAVGVEFKKALFNIAARVINDIRAATTEIEATNTLNAELTISLNHIPIQLLLQKSG